MIEVNVNLERLKELETGVVRAITITKPISHHNRNIISPPGVASVM